MNAAYMVVGGAAVAALQAAGVGVSMLFAALGGLTFAFMAYVLRAWLAEIERVRARQPEAAYSASQQVSLH
jgi:hypothetical protein